jgi:hypothetical protein
MSKVILTHLLLHEGDDEKLRGRRVEIAQATICLTADIRSTPHCKSIILYLC